MIIGYHGKPDLQIRRSPLMFLLLFSGISLSGCTSKSGSVPAEPDAVSQMAPSGKNTPARFVDDQLIIRFSDTVSPERRKELLDSGSARIISRFNDPQLVLVELYGESSVEEATAYFGDLVEVDFAEPNHVLTKDDLKK